MSSAILATLREKNHDDKDKLSRYLDEIMRKASLDSNDYLHEVINALIESNLPYTHIIDHPFFVHIRDTFVKILQKPVKDFDLLCHIGQLFSQLVNNADKKHVHLFQKLLVNATTIDCLNKSLDSLRTTSDSRLIDAIRHMINAYEQFQRRYPAVQNDPNLFTLTMHIVDFSNLLEYKSAFFQLLTKQDQLTSFQELILIACPKYIVHFWGERQKEVACLLAQQVLNRSSEILQHFLSFIDDWKETLISCVFYLVWLCQYCADDDLLSKYNVQHRKMLDCALEIIQGKELWRLANEDSKIGNLQKRASQLVCYATLYIYATSFSSDLRCTLKELNITPLLLKLTLGNFEKTQFHAYRLLAVVLSSDDIKKLENPAQITDVFIAVLQKKSTTKQRIENLFISLKSLIQHDQIKVEFTKHPKGLPLLVRYATDAQSDPEKVQLPVLEILMSLTFNNEAEDWLRQNNTFVQHLRTLASNQNTPDLQKAANGILWRLFSKNGTSEPKFPYDVMISYSHKDKDICHRIYNALLADKLRVWIDLEEMHGAMMQAMANAVEQSRCILICMSESYFLSPYCQAEAQYAFEKQRHLVPIRVQAGYKADGWLGILVAGRIYVDFIKLGFTAAYNQTMLEISKKQASKRSTSVVISHSHVSDTPTTGSELLPRDDWFKELKSDINQLKDNFTQNQAVTREELSLVTSNIASLQKRVELIDTRFEKIDESLNWMMKAMARVKMATEDPPFIEHKHESISNREQQVSSEDAQYNRQSSKLITSGERQQPKHDTSTKKHTSMNNLHESNAKKDS